MKKTRLIIGLVFLLLKLNAQNDTTQHFVFSGYSEIYYSYNFSDPLNKENASFLYNHKRHNEPSINLILAKVAYNEKKIRSNLAVMNGNYAWYNLVAEPRWAQYINEANIGLKISKNKNIWLDAGIMPSHIGFESAVSADCYTLTRSILAENSPYYETGVKLSYKGQFEKFSTAILYLNGWQKIKRTTGIKKSSFGLLLNYKPNTKLSINYNNFIGSDKPDSINTLRIFHNFYIAYEASSKLGFIVGVDIGRDKYNKNDYGIWYSPILISRFGISNKLKLAARLEYYSDEKQIIISNKNVNQFKCFGASLGLDYSFSNRIVFRSELKKYSASNAIFENGISNHETNTLFTTSLSLKL